jgi:hypothetical protein
MRKIAFGVAALVLAALIGGGLAWASIPAPDGTINGCRKISNPAQGSLIVIDSTASCPSGFVALNWRQVGIPQDVTSSGVLSFDPNLYNGTNVACPIGKFASGGGGELEPSGNNDLEMVASWPLILDGQIKGWQVLWRNTTSTQIERTVTIHAVCI